MQGSLASSDVHRELARVNRLVMIEVKAVLDDAIDALVEEHCVSDVKREREKISKGERMKIVRAYSRLQYERQSDAGSSSTGSKHITQKLRDATGMPRLSTRKVRRWLLEGPAKRMGRSVDVDFEKQVLDELVCSPSCQRSRMKSRRPSSRTCATRMTASCKPQTWCGSGASGPRTLRCPP